MSYYGRKTIVKFVSREQLHNHVWAEPQTKVAKKYNLPYHQFTKLCKNLCIPVPEVGHWQKVQFGHKVKTTPLPPYCSNKLKPMAKLNTYSLPSIKKTLIVIPESPLPVIKINQTLSNPHPLIEQAKNALKDTRLDKYGTKRLHKKYIDFRVSPALQVRALRILDGLFKWAEGQGYTIRSGQEHWSNTGIVIDGEEIEISIEEKSSISKTTNVPSAYSSRIYQEHEYTPTGKLTLLIKSYCFNWTCRRTWAEGSTSTLEDLLPEYANELVKIAKARKIYYGKQRDEETKEAIRKKEKDYLRKCEELENEFLLNIEKESDQWARSMRLRDFITAVETKAKSTYKHLPFPKELSDWLEVANKYANEIDPLTKGLPSYQKASDMFKIEDI